MSFSEGMNLCLRWHIPLVMLALSFYAISLATSNATPSKPQSSGFMGWGRNATESAIDYTMNDHLLGLQDAFFWFLVPFFGVMSIGVCVVVNFATLGLTHLLSEIAGLLSSRPSWLRLDGGTYGQPRNRMPSAKRILI
jgi:hypothetical protein